MPTPRLPDLARAGLLLCCLALPVSAADPEADAIGSGRGTSKAPATPDDDRVDTQTGRDVRIWPPDCPFVHKHMKLEVTIPDMAHSAFTAVDTLTLTPAVYPQSVLSLDAGPSLKFGAVTVNGRPARLDQDIANHKIRIKLGRVFAPGESIVVRMPYSAARAGGGGAGMTWSKDDPSTPEEDFAIHTQGQPQTNHLWFPCHDFPNLRLSTEVIATVPDPYEAVSNGRLLDVTHRRMHFPGENGEPGPSKAMTTYHWLQDKPHVYYLVVLTVGRYDVVNVGGPDSARPGLWMPVYGPLGSADRLKTLFGDTPAMIAYFESLLGIPFPWDKYAQIICRDFSAGAMENTSATTLNEFAARGRRRTPPDDIISHELLHQWFGDRTTCAAWEHLWLNEGWATLGESLWVGKQKGHTAYIASMVRNANIERAMSNKRSAPADPGMVTNRYADADERFMGADNVYHKGGMILHMLRMRLGDDVFFRASSQYLKDYAFAQAETDDFRIELERASGQSLERFFNQWAYRPGHPDLAIYYTWTDATSGNGGKLAIKIEQLQPIDAANPAYAFVLPFVAKFKGESDNDSTEQEVSVALDTRETEQSFNLPRKPSEIQIDPNLTVLSRNKVRQPLADSLSQLRKDHPFYVRFQAALAIADDPSPDAIAALHQLIDDAPADTQADPEIDSLVLRDIAEDALNARAMATPPQQAAAR